MFDDAKAKADESKPTIAANKYNETVTSKTEPTKEKVKEPTADELADAAADDKQLEKADLNLDDADVADLREMAGVDLLGVLPEAARETWDETLEAAYLDWGVREGLPSATIERIGKAYIDGVILYGRSPDEMIAELKQRFRGELTTAQMDLLVKFLHQDIYGHDAAE